MKILIVVDMQNDFITGSLGIPEAQAIVPNVVKKIEDYKSKNERIFVTYDTHYDDWYLDTIEGQKLPIKHCILGTEGQHLAKPIWDVIKSFTNVVSCQKWSFGSVEMADLLKDYVRDIKTDNNFKRIVKPINEDKLESIEIIGLCTDICVMANAIIMKSAFPYVPIIVDASCCAGSTSEAHRKALELMRDSLQIDIINWEDNNGERPKDM